MVSAKAIPRRPAPPAFTSVVSTGKTAAVVLVDGSVSVYDVLSGGASAPTQRTLPAQATAFTLNGEKRRGRGKGLEIAYADRQGRVFVGLGAGGGDGEEMCVLEDGVVMDGSSGMVVAAGGMRREVFVKAGKEDARRFEVGAEFVGGISAVALAPGNGLVGVCGQAVVLLDTASGKAVAKYGGHASPVTSCLFLAAPEEAKCGYFVSACSGDQFLNVWEVLGAKSDGDMSDRKKRRVERGKNVGKVCHTLVAPEKGARSITVEVLDGGFFSVAAVLPSGSVAVWKALSFAGGATSSPVSFTINCGAGDAVIFAAVAKPGVLTVAHGQPMRPEFFTVEVEDVVDDYVDVPVFKGNGMLVSDQAAAESDRRNRAVRTEQKASVVKGTAAVAKKGKPTEADGEDGDSGEVGDTLMDIVEDGAAQVDVDHAGGDGDGEVTLREKLASLGVDAEGVGSTLEMRKEVSGDGAVESTGNVLGQAIRMKDDKLFDSVIGSSSKVDVMKATIKRIPFTVATNSCLDMLVSRLIEKPSRAPVLVPWIKCILIEHAGAMASRGRSVAIDRMLAAISARVETLPALTRLEGRLELVLAQADRVREARNASATRSVADVEYVERAVMAGEEGKAGEGTRHGESDDDSSDSDESDSPSDSGDAEETGDFSESSEDSESSSEDEMEEGAPGANSRAGVRPTSQTNGKVKHGMEDIVNFSTSEMDV